MRLPRDVSGRDLARAQLGALGLVVNIIVLWNTLYMDAALARLRTEGLPVHDEDVARLSPLIHDHINMLGRYSFALPEAVARGELRPQFDPPSQHAYHYGMPRERLYWTLIFTDASLHHLAERGVDAEDVADAVFGRHGPARVRHGGRGRDERWFVVGPLIGGELLTCVLRAAKPRDLEADGAFVIPPAGPPEEPAGVAESTRLCVSARISDEDEVQAYRLWRRGKRGR